MLRNEVKRQMAGALEESRKCVPPRGCVLAYHIQKFAVSPPWLPSTMFAVRSFTGIFSSMLSCLETHTSSMCAYLQVKSHRANHTSTH